MTERNIKNATFSASKSEVIRYAVRELVLIEKMNEKLRYIRKRKLIRYYFDKEIKKE